MYREVKGTRIIKTISKKNEVGRLTISNFKMYCKATLIKTVWCIDQRHGIDGPEIRYSQLIF